MAFKGTPRRSVLDIAREIDQLGGICNAFTSKEQTCFHGKVLAEHLPRLVDLLGDLVLNPPGGRGPGEGSGRSSWKRFTPRMTTRKNWFRSTSPATSGGTTPSGGPSWGKRTTLPAVSREDLRPTAGIAYRPEDTVVAAAGRVNHQELVDSGGRGFRRVSPTAPRAEPARPVTTHPGVYALSRDLEQVNLCLGAPGIAAGDPRRYAATMLQLVLGGNMSSRLFQVIREQLGLAYSI